MKKLIYVKNGACCSLNCAPKFTDEQIIAHGVKLLGEEVETFLKEESEVPSGLGNYTLDDDGSFILNEGKKIKADALIKIATLEREITPRRLREAVISEDGKAWLEAKDAEIAIERAKL